MKHNRSFPNTTVPPKGHCKAHPFSDLRNIVQSMSVTQVQHNSTPQNAASKQVHRGHVQPHDGQAMGLSSGTETWTAGHPQSGAWPPSAIWSPHGLIQAKLAIGAPDDAYEREADAVADRVMRMPISKAGTMGVHTPSPVSVQRKCAHCEQEEEQGKVQRKPTENAANGAGYASAALTQQIHATRGGGQALDGEDSYGCRCCANEPPLAGPCLYRRQ
jgi:hypothetical protein